MKGNLKSLKYFSDCKQICRFSVQPLCYEANFYNSLVSCYKRFAVEKKERWVLRIRVLWVKRMNLQHTVRFGYWFIYLFYFFVYLVCLVEIIINCLEASSLFCVRDQSALKKYELVGYSDIRGGEFYFFMFSGIYFQLNDQHREQLQLDILE